MTTLRLGIPSKGRLMADTIGWFAERGIAIEIDDATREYAARTEGSSGLEIVMLSAGEIPMALGSGRIDLGVTGEDLIREHLGDTASRPRLLARLGFGQADVVVGVPAFWIDVESMHDLEEAAYDFRMRRGSVMRVATKYHALTRRFFREHGIADYRLVDSLGATEAAPKNQIADVIVDITSTGATLRDNHLKMLDDGLILQSQAALWVSETLSIESSGRNALQSLKARLHLD